MSEQQHSDQSLAGTCMSESNEGLDDDTVKHTGLQNGNCVARFGSFKEFNLIFPRVQNSGDGILLR